MARRTVELETIEKRVRHIEPLGEAHPADLALPYQYRVNTALAVGAIGAVLGGGAGVVLGWGLRDGAIGGVTVGAAVLALLVPGGPSALAVLWGALWYAHGSGMLVPGAIASWALAGILESRQRAAERVALVGWFRAWLAAAPLLDRVAELRRELRWAQRWHGAGRAARIRKTLPAAFVAVTGVPLDAMPPTEDLERATEERDRLHWGAP